MPRRKNTAREPDKKQKLDSRGLEQAAVNRAEGDDSKKTKVENWADDRESDAYEDAAKLYTHIQKCYDNKQEQNDNIEEYWNIYNCIPDANQQYNGNSTCYVPAIRDACDARVKRVLRQNFPVNHKHVSAVSATGEVPYAQLALLEHYIRKGKLKNTVARPCLIHGDVTGQWTLYVDWTKGYRQIREIVKKPQTLVDTTNPEKEIEDPFNDEETVEDREILEEGPMIEVIATEDLAVYPPTVNDIEKSKASAVRLRLSEERVEELVEEGVFILPSGFDTVEKYFDKKGVPDQSRERVTPAKKRTLDAGIKIEGTWKYLLCYEVHTKLDLGNGKELCYVYYGGPNQILGIIRSPLWSGRRPVISAPIEEITGSFFGISKFEKVKFIQWNLTDFWNMGQDSAQYGLSPIVMTDPFKNPQYQSFVIGLAAVWLTDPNTTKFMTMPDIYKNAFMICDAMERRIWQSMDVNEFMMGKMPQGRKNNQMMGQMQQEANANILDHAERFEEMILTPLVEMIAELDRQFRTDALTVTTMGELGQRARVDVISAQQFGETFFYQWCGTAYVMSMQRMQQMIAWMNVLRGLQPQNLGGRELDISPIAEFGTEQIFGPELAPRILVDKRDMFTIPMDVENEMLYNGLPVQVHPADNDVEHIRSHAEAAKISGDPKAVFRKHMVDHLKQAQEKAQKQAGAPGGAQGMPAGGAPQGVPGTPRPGAQPAPPKAGVQQPAGAIHPDAMAGMPGRG